MRTGRPPKKPEDRKTSEIKIPLTSDEKELIKAAARVDEVKHVTWARRVLLTAAKRKLR